MSQWESRVQQGSAQPSPSSSPGRRPVVIGVIVVVVALVVAGSLALSGVFAGDGVDGPSADGTTDAASTPSASPSLTAEPTPEEELPGVTFGTPEDPLAPGENFVMFDDWTITLGATDLDTWPDLEPPLQQQFPDKMDLFAPDPGMVFVSAPASVTYTGAPEDQDRILALTVEYITADGTPSGINMCGNYGGAVERFDTIDLDTEPLLEGTACTEVTSDQAAGGMWRFFVSWIEPDGARNYVHVYYTTT